MVPIEPHYILAVKACAEMGLGARAAHILLRMQARGMRYGRAAAVAMVACNRGEVRTEPLPSMSPPCFCY